MHANAVFHGHCGFGPQQVFGIVDIGRVRSEPRDDPAIGGALLLDEGGGLGQFGLTMRCIAQLHDAVSHDCAEAAVPGGFRDFSGEEILIAEGGRARQHHFGAGQGDRRTDVLGHQRQFRLADRVVPAFHRQQALPLGPSTKQDHCRMGMGIDQTRHDQMPGQADELIKPRGIGAGFAGPDPNNPAVCKADPTAVIDAVQRIHRQDRGVGDQH